MDDNATEQKRVLDLLQAVRYPTAGQIFPTARMVNAVIEGLIYLVENTPSARVSVDSMHSALLRKAKRSGEDER